MTWLGTIRDTSPVDPTPRVSEYQQNTSMRVANELQRRNGYQSSLLDKQDGPILAIASVGNFLTFDIGSTMTPGVSSGDIAGETLGVGLVGPKKRKPIIDPPDVCTPWASFLDQGTTVGGVFNHTLPASACAGTITVIGVEADDGGSDGDGLDYGYDFVVTADGVPILSSGCLINDSAFAAIPPDTITVSITVTVDCMAQGADPGNWTVQGTQP